MGSRGECPRRASRAPLDGGAPQAVASLPDLDLGTEVEFALSVTARPGGKVRVAPSSKHVRVVSRPKKALDPDQTAEVVVAFAPAAVGDFDEYVEVIAQYATVRVPIVGTVLPPGAE